MLHLFALQTLAARCNVAHGMMISSSIDNTAYVDIHMYAHHKLLMSILVSRRIDVYYLSFYIPQSLEAIAKAICAMKFKKDFTVFIAMQPIGW